MIDLIALVVRILGDRVPLTISFQFCRLNDFFLLCLKFVLPFGDFRIQLFQRFSELITSLHGSSCSLPLLLQVQTIGFHIHSPPDNRSVIPTSYNLLKAHATDDRSLPRLVNCHLRKRFLLNVIRRKVVERKQP